MLSSVLNSERAMQVNILIVRAFVQLRTLLASHRELAAKLAELERKLEGHDVAIHIREIRVIRGQCLVSVLCLLSLLRPIGAW
jgi:hypothetical protein